MKLIVVTLVFILHIVAPALTYNGQNKAIEDSSVTVEINGTTYFFSDNSLAGAGYIFTWQEAKKECSRRNMQLVSFETREEYEAVRQWLTLNKDYDASRWTSGRQYCFNDNKWTWDSTGVEFQDPAWAESYPFVVEDNLASCVSFQGTVRSSTSSSVMENGLEAHDCIMYKYYICEQVL